MSETNKLRYATSTFKRIKTSHLASTILNTTSLALSHVSIFYVQRFAELSATVTLSCLAPPVACFSTALLKSFVPTILILNNYQQDLYLKRITDQIKALFSHSSIFDFSLSYFSIELLLFGLVFSLIEVYFAY